MKAMAYITVFSEQDGIYQLLLKICKLGWFLQYLIWIC